MGQEGACKTSLALHTAGMCQRAGIPVAYVETEGRLVMERLPVFGIDLDLFDRGLIRAADIGELEGAIYAVINAAKAAKSPEPTLLVWDSLAATRTVKEHAAVDSGEAQTKGGGIADRAREYSRIIRAIADDVRDTNIAVVVVNQLRTDIRQMFGDNQVSPGGAAMKYWAALRVGLRYPSAIKKGDERVGLMPQAILAKSLFSPPNRKIKLPFYYETGFDAQQAVCVFGAEHELLASDQSSEAAAAHVLELMAKHEWRPKSVPKAQLGWAPPKSKKKTTAKKASKKG
jgi:recombination protein RecA